MAIANTRGTAVAGDERRLASIGRFDDTVPYECRGWYRGVDRRALRVPLEKEVSREKRSELLLLSVSAH